MVAGCPVAAVLLDLDDTLVDTRAAFAVAIETVTASALPHVAPGDRAAALAHWVADAGGHFRSYTRGEISFLTQRRRRAEDLHAAFGGPPLDDAAFQRWNQDYESAFRGAWRLLPDAVELLEALEGRGLPFGVVTNAGRDHQLDKLAQVGLGGRVRTLVTVDDLGVGKPDRRVFLEACRRLGSAPEATVYVGDELDVDARGARDAGLVGVWLDRWGRAATDPVDDVVTVGSLAALRHLLGL